MFPSLSAHLSHSWFVPACQHLVSHVSLPHVFTLHASSVIEFCSYWLGGNWAGMLPSWNWRSFRVSIGGSQWDIEKYEKHWVLNGRKRCRFSRWPWVPRVLIRLFSPLGFLLQFTRMVSFCLCSVYSFWLVLYFPFLCLVLLFQFWIYVLTLTPHLESPAFSHWLPLAFRHNEETGFSRRWLCSGKAGKFQIITLSLFCPSLPFSLDF